MQTQKGVRQLMDMVLPRSFAARQVACHRGHYRISRKNSVINLHLIIGRETGIEEKLQSDSRQGIASGFLFAAGSPDYRSHYCRTFEDRRSISRKNKYNEAVTEEISSLIHDTRIPEKHLLDYGVPLHYFSPQNGSICTLKRKNQVKVPIELIVKKLNRRGTGTMKANQRHQYFRQQNPFDNHSEVGSPELYVKLQMIAEQFPNILYKGLAAADKQAVDPELWPEEGELRHADAQLKIIRAREHMYIAKPANIIYPGVQGKHKIVPCIKRFAGYDIVDSFRLQERKTSPQVVCSLF